MCARTAQKFTLRELRDSSGLRQMPNLQPRYNISPTDPIDVLRPANDGLELVSMRWGLIPSFWKKPAKDMLASWNAMVETVDTKPTFRDAFKRRRCLVPVSGFYEWTGAKGDKQGHYFTAADGSPVLLIAGLWDQWHDPEQGGRVESCTMIVGSASEWMRVYHDRLVVTLAQDQLGAWLDGSMSRDDLERAQGVPLQQWEVSRRVNYGGRGKDDDPDLILPV